MYARRLHSVRAQVKPPLTYRVQPLAFYPFVDICAHVLLCSLQLAIHHSDTYYPAIRQMPDRQIRLTSPRRIRLFSLDEPATPRSRAFVAWQLAGKARLGRSMRHEALLSSRWPKGRRGEINGRQGSPSVRELGVLFDRGCLFGWP